MNNRIIVTGANSFLGSNIVHELLASRNPVTALIKNSTSAEYLKKMKCYSIISTDNYLDPSVVRKLSISKPEYFIHCSWNDEKISQTRDVLQAIELANVLNCKSFITLGSYEEYGCEQTNLTEDLVCNPKTESGCLNLSFYLLCKSICDSLKLKHCHARLSLPYSAKNNSDFYYTKVIKAISKGYQPELENPLNSKDYIHASDVARGIMALIKNDAEGVFNLGFGESVQNKTLLNMLFEEFNKKIKNDQISEEMHKSKVCFSLSNKKIYSATSWKPTISIWDGLSMLINENKFNSKSSFTEFTKTVRSLYR